MSDSYIGVPFVNRVSPNFLKEDFDGSNLSTINGHANSYELSAEVPGANAENLMVVIDNVIQQPDVAYIIRENAPYLFTPIANQAHKDVVGSHDQLHFKRGRALTENKILKDEEEVNENL